MNRLVNWLTSKSSSSAKREQVMAEMIAEGAETVFESVHANEDFVITMTARLRKYVCAIRFDMMKNLTTAVEFGKSGRLLESVRVTRDVDEVARRIVAKYLNATSRYSTRNRKEVTYIPLLCMVIVVIDNKHIFDVCIMKQVIWDVLLDGVHVIHGRADTSHLYMVATHAMTLLE